MRFYARFLGGGLLFANAVIVPLLYAETRPHQIDWWNVGLAALGLALLGLSFVPRRRRG